MLRATQCRRPPSLRLATGARELARSSNWLFVLALATVACGGALDAGYDEPRGLLPVDSRNPVVVCNDGPIDNWQGEYVALLASTGGISLAGIVISDSAPWPNLADNLAGWQQMVTAARDSGLRNIPDPMQSKGPVLFRPSDGSIDSTKPNRSEGASFILDISKQRSSPFRPLAVVTGGRLTDLADAYLMDHSVPERVVVVSALGTTAASGGAMGSPNGDMDTWADYIVAQKYRYVQVSAFYDQATDFPSNVLQQLPTNTFTSWIKAKQPNVWKSTIASDQVGILALTIPAFVTAVNRVTETGFSSDTITPVLSSDRAGSVWLVTQIKSAVASAQLWQMLLDPATFQTK